MRAVVLVFVVACGASPPPPAPRPTTASGTIALLEQVAERACACKDASCAYTLEQELETTLAGLPTFLDDPAFARGDAAIQRGITCLWAHEVVGWAYAELALSASAALRDQTCACRDETCGADVSTRLDSAVTHLNAVPRSLDRIEALDDIEATTSACVDQLVFDGNPLLREAVAVKDQLCACELGDVACGEAGFQTFMEAFRAIGASQPSSREAVLAKDLVVEVTKCASRTGWRPAPP